MTNVQITGINLNVVERGSGIPLLLAHGFPLDHSMWSGQLEGLAVRGGAFLCGIARTIGCDQPLLPETEAS